MPTNRLTTLAVVDPVLTEIAIGYTNAAAVGNLLFPRVGIPKEFAKIPKFTKESFKLINSQRQIRAGSNVMSPANNGTIDVMTEEHDLAYPIDYREEQAAAFPLESHATMVTMDSLALELEKMQADLAQNIANYPSGNSITLAGTSVFTNAASNPFKVIEDAKQAVRAKIGRYPNTMVMGPKVYVALQLHASIQDRIKYTQKGIVSKDLLKELFGMEALGVGEMIWSNDAESVMTDVWGSNIVLAYAPQVEKKIRSPYAPSFGYTPDRSEGEDSYPRTDTYLTEGGKVQFVRTTDFYKPLIVGNDAGYLIVGAA